MSTEPLKSAFLIMLNSRRLGRGPSTALSIDWDLDQAENLSLEVDSRHVIPLEVALSGAVS